MRWLLRLLVSVAALLTVACAAGPQEPAVDPTALDELQARMADVAAAQREADQRLASTVEAVRQLDGIVGGLRDPQRVDEAKESWPRVDAAWQAAEPDGLRDALVSLAGAVDDARAAMGRVREGLEEGTWPQEYLAAEDEVLVSTRAYAETADRLAQSLQRHWSTYEELHVRTARFVGQRWFYRTPQEAADAYELAVQPMLADLATAQDEIERAREERDAAARDVNRAVEAAREAWEDRPASPDAG